MTKNPSLDTSLCMEKHQSLGDIRINKLWRSLFARLSTLQCLYACQVVWLMNLMKELCIEENEIVTLMIDNVSAINHAKNPLHMSEASI